jgi:hypothetical protein
MSRATLRTAITVLTLITALIHLVLLNLGGKILPLFILNGLGFLALLYALLRPPAFLKGQTSLVHYAFIGYTAVTVIAYFALQGFGFSALGYFTKLVEVLLIGALWMHMRQAA